MPNRIIKESICTSDNLTSLDFAAQLFFLRLTVQCDDFGRYDGRPAIIRAICYPLELDKVSEAQIITWMEELEGANLAWRYVTDGKPCLQITTWSKHQQTRANKSKYPDPPTSAQPCKQPLADDSNGKQTSANALVIGSVSVSDLNNNNDTPVFAQAVIAYQNSIALVAGADQAREMADVVAELESRDLLPWWQMAIKAACDQNVRKWSYVRAILDNSLKTGKPPGAPKPAKANGNGHKPSRRASEYDEAQLKALRDADRGKVWVRPDEGGP